MRIDKFLVDYGIGSRKDVKLILKKKLVTVNGEIVTSPKSHINEVEDVVTYQGEQLVYEEYLYYVLNKPTGVISATEDNHHRTVLDLLDDKARQKEVFPVGRLDIDTTGLLLLTNNGQLSHAMLSPKKHVDKVYEACVDGIMTDDDIKAFENGIQLSDYLCQPALLDINKVDVERGQSVVHITIHEGKFHQVKRMVAACGKTVLTLKRLSMGPLSLDSELKEGEWRRLSAEELEALSHFGVSL